MSFHDSMIEAGYFDEQDYLDHLFDVADKAFEEQSNIKYEEESDYDDSDDNWNEDAMEYAEWLCDNHRRKILFLMWFNLQRESGAFDNPLDARRAYIEEEEYCNNEVKESYGQFFNVVMHYVEWRENNLAEEVFREPKYDLYDEDGEYIGFRGKLSKQVEEWFHWMRKKQIFDSLSEEEKEHYKAKVEDFVNKNGGILKCVNKIYSEQAENFDDRERGVHNRMFRARQEFFNIFMYSQSVLYWGAENYDII